MTGVAEQPGRWVWPALADLLAVLVLALGGRSAHHPDGAVWAVLAIAWPFALAVVAAHGWLAWRLRPARRTWPEGATVLVVTYALGMALRALAGGGLAPAFLVVALLVLTATMLGWRLVVSRVVAAT